MFEKLLSSATALRRHQDGPLAAERERYLQHCSDTGATYWSMRIKCNELLWAARLLDGGACRPEDDFAECSHDQAKVYQRHSSMVSVSRVVERACRYVRISG
jgi:integrase/recombinase XerD